MVRGRVSTHPSFVPCTPTTENALRPFSRQQGRGPRGHWRSSIIVCAGRAGGRTGLPITSDFFVSRPLRQAALGRPSAGAPNCLWHKEFRRATAVQGLAGPSGPDWRKPGHASRLGRLFRLLLTDETITLNLDRFACMLWIGGHRPQYIGVVRRLLPHTAREIPSVGFHPEGGFFLMLASVGC